MAPRLLRLGGGPPTDAPRAATDGAAKVAADDAADGAAGVPSDAQTERAPATPPAVAAAAVAPPDPAMARSGGKMDVPAAAAATATPAIVAAADQPGGETESAPATPPAAAAAVATPDPATARPGGKVDVPTAAPAAAPAIVAAADRPGGETRGETGPETGVPAAASAEAARMGDPAAGRGRRSTAPPARIPAPARRGPRIGAAAALGGGLALALVAALTLGALAALALRAEPGRGLGPAEWAAVRFTLLQSLLSAALSAALAVPVARALARRRFPGRTAMTTLLGAPFLLPAIVAVFGLVAIWGRGGLVSDALALLGLGPLDVYGLRGVVLAHVFFNLPLVARLLLQGWAAIPAEQLRLAAQLGFGPRDVFLRIELPMLRAVLPGAATLVFLLCMTSFAVALTLGGGPRATTVELAIYQAIRFDFDLGRAAWLAVIQFGICAAAAALALRAATPAGFAAGLGAPPRRWDAGGAGPRAADAVALAALALFLGLPLGAVALRGLAGLAALPAQVWPAAGLSLAIALVSAGLAFALGLGLAGLADALRARDGRGRSLGVETFGLMSLAASPFVIGTGLFILLNPVANPFALALPVTAAVNAAMALPFVLRALLPALSEAREIDGRLADSLGMTGLARFRLAVWPRLRRPAGFAAGLAAAFSMGDLGVIALFAPPEVATLPLLMQRLMAAYRMDAAAAVALVLVGLTLALFWSFDRWGRRHAA